MSDFILYDYGYTSLHRQSRRPRITIRPASRVSELYGILRARTGGLLAPCYTHVRLRVKQSCVAGRIRVGTPRSDCNSGDDRERTTLPDGTCGCGDTKTCLPVCPVRLECRWAGSRCDRAVHGRLSFLLFHLSTSLPPPPS